MFRLNKVTVQAALGTGVLIAAFATAAPASAATGGGCKTDTYNIKSCVSATSTGRVVATVTALATAGSNCHVIVDIYRNGSLYLHNSNQLACTKGVTYTLQTSPGQHGTYYATGQEFFNCSSPCAFAGPIKSPTISG